MRLIRLAVHGVAPFGFVGQSWTGDERVSTAPCRSSTALLRRPSVDVEGKQRVKHFSRARGEASHRVRGVGRHRVRGCGKRLSADDDVERCWPHPLQRQTREGVDFRRSHSARRETLQVALSFPDRVAQFGNARRLRSRREDPCRRKPINDQLRIVQLRCPGLGLTLDLEERRHRVEKVPALRLEVRAHGRANRCEQALRLGASPPRLEHTEEIDEPRGEEACREPTPSKRHATVGCGQARQHECRRRRHQEDDRHPQTWFFAKRRRPLSPPLHGKNVPGRSLKWLISAVAC